MSSADKSCGNCRFFDEGEEECRRRAPITLPTMFYGLCLAITRKDAEASDMAGLGDQRGWAHVYEGDWCGEWEPNRLE